MRHAILSLGWFDSSFESLIEGTDIFLLKEGQPARITQTQKVTPDIDGVVFYYMQTPKKGGKEQFVAVRARYKSHDIRFHSPVRIDMERHAGGIKAFCTDIHKMDGDECASELLWDLAIRNPLQFSKLHEIAKETGLAIRKPWDSHRGSLIRP